MRNKIILVGGYCATGKSTFSLKLSEMINIPCFNKDIIKEVLGDGFGPENNIDNFRDGHLQLEIGEAGIGQTIIIDATSFAEVNYEDLFDTAKKFIRDLSERR